MPYSGRACLASLATLFLVGVGCQPASASVGLLQQEEHECAVEDGRKDVHPVAGAPIVVFEAQESPTRASLRGLAVVDGRVAWASGADGTFVRTVDGGATWHAGRVAEGETLDFRDVHAIDSENAWLLAAGAPRVVHRTSDGGRSWRLQYENVAKGVFFDAMAFWDANHGIAVGDPIGGRFLVIVTDDGGARWQAPSEEALPLALTKEAAFAASGTCLAVIGQENAWIGTGGAAARVLRSSDRGRTWKVVPTPLRQGSESSGIFSLAFRDARHGIAVGGDYLEPEASQGNAARTEDGGATWTALHDRGPRGYRSCVAVAPGAATPTWLAVGPSGADVSWDDGRSWTPAASEGFHAVGFAPQGRTGWAVGADGRIARVRLEGPWRTPPAEEAAALRAELLERAAQDQRVRSFSREELTKLGPRAFQVDRENTARLHEIVADLGWPGRSVVGEDGAQAAFLLIQHADHDPEFQARCLPLLEAAAARDEIAKRDVAYLTDRVRVKQKRPQVYGTQYSVVEDEHGNMIADSQGRITYLPPLIEDVDKLDERRRAMGLPPWAEYEKRMAKLQEREVFGAPRPAR